MLTDAGWAQELVAIAIAAGAAAYLVYRMVGRRPKAPHPSPVQVGGRLARGLAVAQDRTRDDPARPKAG